MPMSGVDNYFEDPKDCTGGPDVIAIGSGCTAKSCAVGMRAAATTIIAASNVNVRMLLCIPAVLASDVTRIYSGHGGYRLQASRLQEV